MMADEMADLRLERDQLHAALKAAAPLLPDDQRSAVLDLLSKTGPRCEAEYRRVLQCVHRAGHEGQHLAYGVSASVGW